MKLKLYTILFLFLSSASVFAQKDKFEHKIVAGYNFGATAPVPIPSEVRTISSYWPEFTPQLGYNVTYNHTSKWAISSGILLDNKGMGVRNRVKYMYTSVILEKDGDRPLTGYFVGRNETRVKSAYVTIPLYIVYKYNTDWNFKIGGYASYKSSSEFKGDVWGGYLRVEDSETGGPTGEKIVIENKGDATFNFGDDIRDFDFGLSCGAERRINDKFGIYSNLSWGLTSIFPNDYKTVSFKMYNIYMAVGLTYKL
ncbi:PorT family protein [Dysgonomonas sp. 216]|uniref:outer membrane beta-barrel protein n=1 Tax=Dysgonomonas sp. 216 TaxID=2302934 RepID=UPI0013D29A83|nr:outer membrane beta-barrel protein [Dysgonomonas sp. 216]NDW17938.1 PorT family protein [Dysgonomonas sp. 216]